MTAHEKPMKPVKLAIDNAADVVPRVISAQGKACGGEFGLVLLPRQAAGMLVHQKDGMAAVWRNDGVGDAPSAPSGQTPAKPEVDALMKLFRSATRGGKDDRALKGTWKGTISCDDGAPDVRLERAVRASSSGVSQRPATASSPALAASRPNGPPSSPATAATSSGGVRQKSRGSSPQRAARRSARGVAPARCQAARQAALQVVASTRRPTSGAPQRRQARASEPFAEAGAANGSDAAALGLRARGGEADPGWPPSEAFAVAPPANGSDGRADRRRR
jgi:hypothetical protein